MDTAGKSTLSSRRRKLLRIASITCLVLAILWFAAALFTEGWSHPPNLNWLRRYAQVTWKSYRDFEFGFRIDHLSHWQVLRPPAVAWTRRTGDGIRSEDVVVIRYHDPYTFVAVVRYKLENEQAPVDWARETQGKGFVASGLGERILQRASRVRHGRTAYEIVAEGPVRDKSFRFASLFIPDGRVAWRVTAGVEAKSYPRVARTIARMLDSFALEGEPVTASPAES